MLLAEEPEGFNPWCLTPEQMYWPSVRHPLTQCNLGVVLRWLFSEVLTFLWIDLVNANSELEGTQESA